MKHISMLAAILTSFLAVFAYSAEGNEVMTDRCSAEVAFPKTYNGNPNDPGTVILARDRNGATKWTPPFKVATSKNGRIRWWCHSTKGNVFDPGTWRVTKVNTEGVIQCVSAGVATVVSKGGSAAGLAVCKNALNIKIASYNGWTAERSRCDNHSTNIRARLGPSRRLNIECLGH
jgi:hypothetical protein